MSADLIAWGTLFAALLAAILRASAPIVLAALGGLVSDLAGSINVALEGIMLVAAFLGLLSRPMPPAGSRMRQFGFILGLASPPASLQAWSWRRYLRYFILSLAQTLSLAASQ